jgi:hypothetical protein
MAQSLEVNIKTTSDVPQAMDKAKAATAGFAKQVGEIGKKFGTSFKDIFLSFLGPMALISSAMAFIGKAIADNQRKREEAHEAALNDTNELMSAEDKYFTKKRENERKGKEKVEQAKLTRQEVTQEFLENDPRGKAILDEIKAAMPPGMASAAATAGLARNAASSKSMQDRVQAMIAEDIKNDPDLAKPPTAAASSNNMLGAGVIGVGSSPQIALAMEANNKLDSIDSKLGELVNAGIDKDPTKPLGRKYPLYSPGMSR